MEKTFVLSAELDQVMDWFGDVAQLLTGDFIYELYSSGEGYQLAWIHPRYRQFLERRSRYLAFPMELWLPTEFQFIASALLIKPDSAPGDIEREAICFDFRWHFWRSEMEIRARCPSSRLANAFGSFLMLTGDEWETARFGTTEAELRLMWELKSNVSPEQWELWKTAQWAAPYLAMMDKVQRTEDLPSWEPSGVPSQDTPTQEAKKPPKPRDSAHYSYPYEKREEIANTYRKAFAQGKIENQEAWAASKYNITARTLRNYLEEFPEEKS